MPFLGFFLSSAGAFGFLAFAPAGAAGFFEKITAEGGSSVPEFLSTHPSPENRVEDINQQKTDLGCEGTVTEASYQDILNSLP